MKKLKLKSIIISLASLFIVISFNQVLALDKETENFFIENDILYYNPDGNCDNMFSINSNIDDGNKSFIIAQELLKKINSSDEINANQETKRILISAIIGNMKHESNFNPNNLNRRDCNEESCYASYGLSQWRAGRFIALMKSANQFNEWAAKDKNEQAGEYNFGPNGWVSSEAPSVSIEDQINYLFQELSSSYKSSVLTPILDLETESMSTIQKVEKATIIYGSNFEVFQGNSDPENPSRLSRIDFAKNFYSLLNNSVDYDCQIETNFYNLGKFKVFKQDDPLWANNEYSAQTFSQAACGPTSLATILFNLGIKTNPVEVVEKCRESDREGTNDQIIYPGNGSAVGGLAMLAKNEYNMEVKAITSNRSSINNHLRQGYFILTNGKGSTPYTGQGHILPILGINDEGKWVLGQTANYLSDYGLDGWDPANVLEGMSNSYAIKNK